VSVQCSGSPKIRQPKPYLHQIITISTFKGDENATQV
jgi:hypothetical protein